MRRWLLLFCIITHVVFAFAGTSAKHAVFSGRWTGHASDTLLFPIRENLDNQIREDIPASPLFLKLSPLLCYWAKAAFIIMEHSTLFFSISHPIS